MSTLGERIKLARGRTSQDAFSRALKISKGALGFYERNENLPNTDVILKICSETGVGIEWLLTGRGSMYQGESTVPSVNLSEVAQQSTACQRCAKLEAKLEKVEEERRELAAENRNLWKENGELREKCARLEERMDKPLISRSPAEMGKLG